MKNRNFPTVPKNLAPVANPYSATWVEGTGRVIFDCFTDSGASPVSNLRTSRWIASLVGVPLRKPHAFYDLDRDNAYPARLANELALGERLRIFYSNSGSEAIEVAIKTARRATDRATVLGVAGDFHGRTYGAMSLQYDSDEPIPEYHYRGYGPFVPALWPLSEGDKDIDLPHHIAAIVVSPVNMNNTLELWPRWVWETAADIRRDGGLIVFDEVQTGFGRGGGNVSITTSEEWMDYAASVATGEPDIYDAMTRPDIYCFGKAMAGGFPMSATVTHERIANVMGPGSHFNTMAGSPLGVALAGYYLTWLSECGRESFLEWARHLADIFPEILRVGGLMALNVPEPQAFAAAILERGIFVAANRPNKPIRFYPPLDIERHERDAIETILKMALTNN